MSSLVYPTGRKPGCLPRRSRPGDYPFAADRIKIVPENEWDDLSQQITLRPHVRKIMDQGQYGACAAYAAVQAMAIAREIAGLPFVELNPLFVYHTTSGGSDNGSSIDDNLDLLIRYGCVPESVWPASKGFRAEPPEEAWQAALEYRIEEAWDIISTEEFVSGELDGFPVVFGSNGHAICGIAHKGSYPEIANSWGEDWENGGFGKWCSYAQVNWSYGAWCPRVAT